LRKPITKADVPIKNLSNIQ